MGAVYVHPDKQSIFEQTLYIQEYFRPIYGSGYFLLQPALYILAFLKQV